jgi:hypothetical protein
MSPHHVVDRKKTARHKHRARFTGTSDEFHVPEEELEDPVEERDAHDEFEKAVEEFASQWKGDPITQSGVSPEDVAPDAAFGFFYAYPQWKDWARALQISKATMKSIVADSVYEMLLEKDNKTMKLTLNSLKRIIREVVESELEEALPEEDEGSEEHRLDMLLGVYSDAYKDRNGTRPRWYSREVLDSPDPLSVKIEKVKKDLERLYEEPLPPTEDFDEDELVVDEPASFQDAEEPSDVYDVFKEREKMKGTLDRERQDRWHGPNVERNRMQLAKLLRR